MQALLMHPDRDFDGEQPVPGHAEILSQDLELSTLWSAMAAGDAFVLDVARKATLLAIGNDAATVRHRQQVLTDVLAHPADVRALYALAVEAMTHPPDAFNGPDADVALAAGATREVCFTIGAFE